MNIYSNHIQALNHPIQMKEKQNQMDRSTDFAQVLKSTIEKVNNAQLLSDTKTEALAKGKIEHLHDVMITAQKASIALETTVQIQRKVIDAYNEIMRMQV
ncbi:flagellar hook-basal body complex protein FliE [Cerasibacillus sp.]|uniref:flagellar hook-basal body complex protein FliE n=1 Tax=Cerasibacillus sp. TaxID=2498711 RepID=UPI0039C86FDB